MAGKNMRHKAVSGMFWTALQKYSTMFIQFISGIILARLLTPYDYGCIGMLGIFMILAETFIDGGFGSALIQKKKPTQVDYSTIFWWNMGMAVLMYAILYFSAPAISRFYKIPLLCDVLRVQGSVLFIYAFNIIQRNQLRKNLNFKTLSIVAITTAIISLAVTIFMAYRGFGVWSLVAQNLITTAIPAIVFWIVIKWRPIWSFSWKSFKELFDFGFYMFLTHFINRLSQQIQGLLIGKVYSPDTMGYYSKAQSTEKLASTSISNVMTQVTYPLYASVQDNKATMINMIRRLIMTISYITFPLMYLLLLCAKPIFVLLYSERWLASIPYFQILCIAGLASCLQSINLQTIAAIGKSKVMLLGVIIKRTVGLSAIFLGLSFFGMKGLLVGVVFNAWFSFFVNIYMVDKYIGYKIGRQLLDLLPVFLVSMISAAICYGFSFLLNLNMYVEALIIILIYAIIYMGWSVVFKPEAYNYTALVIKPVLNKIFRRKSE